jgi:hypothetical protein
MLEVCKAPTQGVFALLLSYSNHLSFQEAYPIYIIILPLPYYL